jgi:hypothetical protein
MNGQLKGERPPITGSVWSRLVQIKCSRGWPLCVALACSFLLHAVIFLAPYFVSHARYVLVGGSKVRHHVLSAKLVAAGDVLHARQDSQFPAGTAASLPGPVKTGEEAETLTERAVGENEANSPEAVYYPTRQLTRPPQVLNELELADPEVRSGVASGKIILKLWISVAGEVVRISTEETELSETVTGSVVEAFLKLRFKPGELDGQPVGVVMVIEVDYDEGRFPER